MILTDPVIICPRLLPGVCVNGVYISIEYSPRLGNSGRTRYRYHIDLPGHNGSHTADDLQSGCGGGKLQEGLENLLSLLSACGESHSYSIHAGEPGENTELFSLSISEWCAKNSDELSVLECELQENPNAIQE